MVRTYYEDPVRYQHPGSVNHQNSSSNNMNYNGMSNGNINRQQPDDSFGRPVPKPVPAQAVPYVSTAPFPFHSPHIDPVGSIVGLRVTYVDGKLAYVPVDPQINYLINQQFGHLSFTPPPLPSPYAASNVFGSVPIFPQGYHPSVDEQYRRTPQSMNQMNSIPREAVTHIPPNDPGPSHYGSHSEPPPQQRNRMPKPADDDGDWFKPNPQPQSGVRRSRNWNAAMGKSNNNDQEYNPWGQGGCGAPLKDPQGNLIADRRRLREAWTRPIVDADANGSQTNSPIPNRLAGFASFSPSNETPQRGNQPNPKEMSSQERHKMELMQQIEENKRRREEQKRTELELELKEIKKLEEYNARIRREEEEQKLREREKAIANERRRALMQQQQEAKAAAAQQQRRRRSPPPSHSRRDELELISDARRTHQEDHDDPTEEPAGVEWWEKQPAYSDDRQSAVIAQARGRPPRDPTPSRRNRGENRPEPVRPDSAEIPSGPEWWEKKPSYTVDNNDRRSPVIPALKGKPPTREEMESRARSASRATASHSANGRQTSTDSR